MNKVRIIGLIILLLGIGAHYLLDTIIHGFWIGASMGLGIGLLVIGKVKKVW
jgi:hypothetical protein